MVTDDSQPLDGALTMRPGAEVAALVAALGTGDAEVVSTLFACGVRAATVPLLEWLPAVEVCWVDGASEAERHALRVQYIADERHLADGLTLIDDWLAKRPAPSVFRAARRALQVRLSALDDDARPALLEAVVSRCEAAGRAAGADFGVGALSPPERAFVATLRAELTSPS